MFCECGTGSFKHVDDEDPADISLSGGSPNETRKRGAKVNPYAERGLERFSTVLSELESRRAKILRHVGSDTGLVMIWFVQSKDGWAPVVVKLPVEPFVGAKKRTAAPAAPAQPAASISTTPDQAITPKEGATVNATARVEVKSIRRASFSWGMMRRPSRYLPAVIVLTLANLVVFGRMFAICLASVCWYLLPTVGSGRSDGAGPKRRTMQQTKHASRPQRAETDEVVSSPRSHAKGNREDDCT